MKSHFHTFCASSKAAILYEIEEGEQRPFLEPKYRTVRFKKCTTNTVIRILNGDEKFSFTFEEEDNLPPSNNNPCIF